MWLPLLKLRPSPATVSHRLSKLEKALSTVLLFRDSRRIRLSPAGELFYQRAGAILEALYDAEHQIGARGSAVSGFYESLCRLGSFRNL